MIPVVYPDDIVPNHHRFASLRLQRNSERLQSTSKSQSPPRGCSWYRNSEIPTSDAPKVDQRGRRMEYGLYQLDNSIIFYISKRIKSYNILCIVGISRYISLSRWQFSSDIDLYNILKFIFTLYRFRVS